MKTVDRDTFIEQNMGLVGKVVNKHAFRITGHSDMDREDLVSIGTIGLIKAYDRFDPSFEVKFSTYAFPMIEGEIRRYLRDSLETVRFTRQSKVDYYAISSAKLLNENPEVIADTLEMPIVRVKNALDYHRCKAMDSLDREVYDEGGTPITLADNIGIEVDFDSGLEIKSFLESLDERARKIVELRLQDLTQAEIGKIIGVTQVQVSRILLKLQRELKGGTKMSENKSIEKKVMGKDENRVKERQIIQNKISDCVLAKKLAEETELNPNQISKKSGVSYTTARNYVSQYRIVEEKKKEITVEEVAPIVMEKHRLDIPIEIINKPETKSSDGFMTMTLRSTVDDAKTQLEDIIKAMETLGFKELNITIQSEQVA